MEKTIELTHGGFKAVVPSPRRFSAERDFGVEEFESVSKKSIPAWKAYKAGLFDEYSTLGFPAWKRSRLERLELPPLELDAKMETETTGARVALLEESEEALKLVRDTDFEGSDRKFVLQSVAFNASGVFVESQGEGVVVLKIDGGERARVVHNVFLVKKGEKLKVVNVLKNTRYASILNRYFVEEGGELSILNIRSDNLFAFTNELYSSASRSKIAVYDIDKPGELHAPFRMALLDGDDARITFKSGFTVHGTSIVDTMYVLRHRAMRTHGKVEGSGVLFDAASSVLRGNIEVEKGAFDTETGESFNAVLLSPRASAVSIPALFVEENEVTASHAATVGALKEEGLYYLMSRGLDEPTAVRLVVGGIFEPMLQEVEQLFGKRWQEVSRDVLTRASAGRFPRT